MTYVKVGHRIVPYGSRGFFWPVSHRGQVRPRNVPSLTGATPLIPNLGAAQHVGGIDGSALTKRLIFRRQPKFSTIVVVLEICRLLGTGRRVAGEIRSRPREAPK